MTTLRYPGASAEALARYERKGGRTDY